MRKGPRRTLELSDALIAEDKNFGQYWAIRALRKQIAQEPGALDGHTGRVLREFQRELAPESDRAYELGAALSEARLVIEVQN